MKLMAVFSFLILSSCATEPVVSRAQVSACVDPHVDLYGDLCAESSSGFEDMSPSDAHFEGVKCAIESIQMCLEDR